MADATVRAATGFSLPSVSASVVYTFPTSPQPPQVGDPIAILVTTNATTTPVSSVPGGWSITYGVAFGTASRSLVVGTYTSGSSVTLTHAGTPGAGSTAAIVVLNGSVHSGFGTLGTITTRASTIFANTAALTGTTAAPNLVVSHEKSATHASAPTVLPATTTIVNQIDATASSGATYVGSYDTSAGTADRTITYPTSSSNGAALQIPLLMVAQFELLTPTPRYY